MDRNIVYPGAIPLDTDILTLQRSIMIGLGALARATLGTTTVFDGLACTQQAAPNMTVLVASGSVLFLSTVDATTFGSLAADTTDTLMKMGINIGPTTLATPAAGIAGQSTNYLIQGAFQESDATSVVLPYYNSSNPAVPYSGPANSGTPQNTQRLQTVNLSVKAGTPATTGTQTTPAADAGFTGLYVVTVAFGAVTVVNANITQLAGAPFLATFPLGAHGEVNAQATTTWTVPNGVFSAKFELWGATGGSGGSQSTGAGSGAGGSGYSRKTTAVTPGTIYAITIATGGTAGGTGTAGGAASGASTVVGTGVSLSVNPGLPGNGGLSGAAGASVSGGSASGGDVNLTGSSSKSGIVNGTLYIGGAGGSSPFGGGVTTDTIGTAQAGNLPGGGPGGGANAQNGVAGNAGYCRITW